MVRMRQKINQKNEFEEHSKPTKSNTSIEHSIQRRQNSVLFSSPHGTFSNSDYMLDHTTSHKNNKVEETKRWSFEKISKISKPLARLTEKENEKNQVTKIRNGKGNITIDLIEINWL